MMILNLDDETCVNPWSNRVLTSSGNVGSRIIRFWRGGAVGG